MRIALTLCFALLSLLSYSQKDLKTLLGKHNSGNIPYITVQELAMPKTDAVVLDAREYREYEVSHLKNAIFVGYNKFNINTTITQLNSKDQMIVVYCSLGIRSEDIAEQLKEKGYTNVYNLYGGIFEWKNNDYTIYNTNSEPTENVHAFSKEWGQWLLKGNKIYD